MSKKKTETPEEIFSEDVTGDEAATEAMDNEKVEQAHANRLVDDYQLKLNSLRLFQTMTENPHWYRIISLITKILEDCNKPIQDVDKKEFERGKIIYPVIKELLERIATPVHELRAILTEVESSPLFESELRDLITSSFEWNSESGQVVEIPLNQEA